MKPFRRSTILDVARKAGVSRSTAGHILGYHSPFTERFTAETKERVMRAARELNYSPNLIAAGLRSGQSSLLALVVEGPWYESSGSERVPNEVMIRQWNLVSAMVSRARERKRMPLLDILSSHTTPGDTKSLSYLTSSGINNIVIKSPHPEVNPLIHDLTQNGYPIISLFPQSLAHLRYNWLDLDNVAAGGLAAEHLIACGYRHFCWIYTENTEAKQLRLKGFRQCLAQAGYEDSLTVYHVEVKDYESRMNQFRQLLNLIRYQKLTGIATADASAYYVTVVAQEMGIFFSKDLGLVGHDCQLWHDPKRLPRITNISVSYEHAGYLAVDMACDLLESGSFQTSPVILPPELEPGETTANLG